MDMFAANVHRCSGMTNEFKYQKPTMSIKHLTGVIFDGMKHFNPSSSCVNSCPKQAEP